LELREPGIFVLLTADAVFLLGGSLLLAVPHVRARLGAAYPPWRGRRPARRAGLCAYRPAHHLLLRRLHPAALCKRRNRCAQRWHDRSCLSRGVPCALAFRTPVLARIAGASSPTTAPLGLPRAATSSFNNNLAKCALMASLC
jgi:hypothetical protein